MKSQSHYNFFKNPEVHRKAEKTPHSKGILRKMNNTEGIVIADVHIYTRGIVI